MLLYNCEKRLLASLRFFVRRFFSVSPISLIFVKTQIGDCRENLLRKQNLVKIGPK
jgi:hypothetical protein